MLGISSEVPEQASSLKVTEHIVSLTSEQLTVRLANLVEKVSAMEETLDSLLEDNSYPETT